MKNKNMTKVDLVKKYGEVVVELAKGDRDKKKPVELPKLTSKQLEVLYDGAFKAVVDLADEGEKVATILGTVEKVHKDAHKGRNPKTKEDIQVPAKDVMKVSTNAFTKKAFK